NTLHKIVSVVKNVLTVPREEGRRANPDSGTTPAGTAQRTSGRVDAPWEDGLCLAPTPTALSFQEVRHELTPRTPPTHSRRDGGCSTRRLPERQSLRRPAGRVWAALYGSALCFFFSPQGPPCGSGPLALGLGRRDAVYGRAHRPPGGRCRPALHGLEICPQPRFA